MRATLLVALALALPACGSGSASSGVSTPIPLASYCDAVAHAQCDRWVPCCRNGGLNVDVGACLSNRRSQCDALVAQQQAKGRTYDPLSAGACVEGGDALFDACVPRSLDDWASARVADACVRVWSGSAQPGEACTEDADCAARANARVACIASGTGRACSALTFARVGQACDPTAGGAKIGCEYGSFCSVPSSGDAGTCVAAGKRGAACDPTIAGACEDGLGCDASSRTCRAPGVLGQSCAGGVPCSDGFYCAPDGTCAAIRVEGEPCLDYDRCADGLACVSGKCHALLAVGATCNWSGQCASGRCDLVAPTYSSGTCAGGGGATHFPPGFDAAFCSGMSASASSGSGSSSPAKTG